MKQDKKHTMFPNEKQVFFFIYSLQENVQIVQANLKVLPV